MQINLFNKNTISCTFTYGKDCECIWDASPWAVKGYILNLIKWPPNLALEEVDFHMCNLWVQVHNLSQNKMNKLNAVKIGQYIGK